MKYATKTVAREVIEHYISSTAYESGEIKMFDLYWKLRDGGFSSSEANVIAAALVLAGAKFQLNDDE